MNFVGKLKFGEIDNDSVGPGVAVITMLAVVCV